MSQLNLIIIKNSRFYFSKCGFRFLLNLINKDFKFLDKFLGLVKQKYCYDEGYYLIDFDNKIIFSNQEAFSSSNIDQEIRNKLKKDFEYYEIF